MLPFVPHIPVVVKYAYEGTHLFDVIWWINVYYGFYLYLFIGQIPVRVTQKYKYYISVCLKNYLLMLHLSALSLSFCIISSNCFKWSDQSPLVIIKSSLMYAWISSNPWNIYFIFSWKISGKFLTPIGRRLYQYFTQVSIIIHRLPSCLLIWIW